MEGKRSATIERLYWVSGWIYDFSKVATILLVVVLIINYFFFSLLVVRGKSMEANYVDGDVQIINRLTYDFHAPQRGDAIAMYFPGETQKRFIKRIIGLPGDQISVRSGHVYINGALLDEPYVSTDIITQPDMAKTVPPNQYFVMGDNRTVSSDSRAWGPVPRSFIIGKVTTRLGKLPSSNSAL